jgi:hypothetical protein
MLTFDGADVLMIRPVLLAADSEARECVCY